MKKSIKVIVIIAIVLAVIIAACSIYTNGIPVIHKGLDYAEQYRNDESGDCVYFTDADFGDYESTIYEVKVRNGIYRCVGSTYTVTYSNEQYDKQKKKISGMNFLNISYKQDDCPVIPEIIPAEKVEADGWIIRILDNGEENNYPKHIAMIGTNDEEKKIAYMYFSDADLDFVSETAGENELKDFIEKNFCFKF